MKYILFFLLILNIIGVAFIITSSFISPTGFVTAIDNENNENEIQSFRLYTKAVCESVSGFTVCRDELFANCGGFEYILPKNQVNGHGVFSEDWEDPRK